jgi:hypothetical protein
MNKSMKQVVFGLIAVASMSVVALAQPGPDPSLWNNVTNPGGLRAVPVVYYDPGTGILSLDSRGLDGVSNTADGMTIGGDDVGAISLLVRGPEPTNAIAPFTNGNFDTTNFILWSYQYFAGRAQLIGSATPTGQFIRPGVNNMFQYATGLGAADFQDVEMAVNFMSGAPGANLFGSVQIVPEPAILSLFGSALLGLGAFCRRR